MSSLLPVRFKCYLLFFFFVSFQRHSIVLALFPVFSTCAQTRLGVNSHLSLMEQSNTETKVSRRKADLVPTTIQLPARLWERLKNDATARRTSLRAVMISRLEDSFRRR